VIVSQDVLMIVWHYDCAEIAGADFLATNNQWNFNLFAGYVCKCSLKLRPFRAAGGVIMYGFVEWSRNFKNCIVEQVHEWHLSC
jgi:hypothetical protein